MGAVGGKAHVHIRFCGIDKCRSFGKRKPNSFLYTQPRPRTVANAKRNSK